MKKAMHQHRLFLWEIKGTRTPDLKSHNLAL